MATNYPGSLDSITAVTGATLTNASVGGRTHSQLHNDTADAVEAVQAELGTDPAGTYATVKARLDATTPVVTGGSPGQLLKLNGSLVPTPDDFIHGSTHSVSGSDRTIINGAHESPYRLDFVQRDQLNNEATLSAGAVYLTYATASASFTARAMRMFVTAFNLTYSAGTPQGAMGLFTVAANGDLTLVARTAKQVMFTTINSFNEYAFSNAGGFPLTYPIVYGQRYAFGWVLDVTGATVTQYPRVYRFSNNGSGSTSAARGALWAFSPRLTATYTATDLPTSSGSPTITAASLNDHDFMYYGATVDTAQSGH